jgi:methionyl-tRNA synthetase
VDEYAAKFEALKKTMNLSYNKFVRTTDSYHVEAAEELWRLCEKRGFIEKGVYKAKYCVGCELEKTDSELVEGKCPLHPNKELELIEEENYFFKMSDPKIGEALLKYYQENSKFVIPKHRMNEINNFVKAGLKDFSISRLKEKMPWGVAVPGDDKHVQYVWFEALTSYISTIGWPINRQEFESNWGTTTTPNAVQVAGKDNLKQQTIMWQAMLYAAGLPFTKQVLIHGFITSGGQKMSKSLGNVIDPIEYVEKYGTDALRYYLLAKMNPFEDSDFTREKFEDAYQADLANGLGNLVARVAAMAVNSKFKTRNSKPEISSNVRGALDEYKFDEAMGSIWEKIKSADRYVSEKRVWELKDKEKEEALTSLVGEIRQIAVDLQPFLPETAEKIKNHFAQETITKIPPLFPRLS